MIKRIFTDMDGTLLNSQGRLAPSNVALIQKAGIPMTLVSARAPMEMKEAIEGLGLTGPQVGFNGGLIYTYKDGKVHPLHIDALGKNEAQNILNYLKVHFPQVSTSYYDLNHWYCATIDEGIRYEYELTRCTPTLIKQEEFYKLQGSLFKIMLITSEEETMQALMKALEAFKSDQISIQRSGAYYLEITSGAAKKSKGISYILKKENLDPQDTAAFGDGHNDIPMLSMVGTPIVMANASDEVKAYAKYLAPSNDEDGVGRGVKKYLTKGKLWSLFAISQK